MIVHRKLILAVILLCCLVSVNLSCKKASGPPESPDRQWQPKFQSFTEKSVDISVDKTTTKIPIDVIYSRGADIHNNLALNIIINVISEETTAIENVHYTLKWMKEYIPNYPEPLYLSYLVPFDSEYTANIQKYELLINGDQITEPVTLSLYGPQFQCWKNPGQKPYIDTITIHITPEI